jgi:hypothetical protein
VEGGQVLGESGFRLGTEHAGLRHDGVKRHC